MAPGSYFHPGVHNETSKLVAVSDARRTPGPPFIRESSSSETESLPFVCWPWREDKQRRSQDGSMNWPVIDGSLDSADGLMHL